MRTDGRVFGAGAGPGDSRRVRRNTAIHLAPEILNDFGAPSMPPDIAGRDFRSALQRQGVRQIGDRIGLGLVVIRMVGDALIPAGAGAESLDTELLQHVLMVFGSCRVHGSRETAVR